MTAPIFMSYSTRDQEIAETISAALEARGYGCWIASRNVDPGENYQEAIVRALRDARVMVLVFTSNANNSDEIKKELALAGRHHVVVVPVRVEDVVPSDAFSYELATRQWIDLFKNWEQEIGRLVTRVGSILETEKPETAPVSAGAARSFASAKLASTRRRQVITAAAIVTVVIVGALVYFRPWVGGPAVTADDAAWAAAQQANTAASFASYLKAFPAGTHTQEAQLRTDDLELAASPVRSSAFDGAWLTTLTCPNGAGGLGFTYQFGGDVTAGVYHGQQGDEGKPGWFALNGGILPDGSAALLGRGIVSASSYAAGNAPTGTGYAYHITAQFGPSGGTGKRVEGRPCTVTFTKQ